VVGAFGRQKTSTQKILIWKTENVDRQLDRQRNDILNENRLSENGLDLLAWDECQCQGAVNTIIVLRVPCKTQSFWVGFSGSTVLHTDG